MFNKKNPIRRRDWANDHSPTWTVGKLFQFNYTIFCIWSWIERETSVVGHQLGGE